ncbi:uncharacterized protein LOC118644087 isoform X2 [Monomorium pharaonis]|uniref:uncharacterized protein LOC114255106 isoform X2 n=1 Tax=Monomorium pharaonis TaxID=307658 RepID=UPI001747402A|nr:uncharacterized protein LOC114255106 isoform X2 [Monomorium pharaonis]XP_036150154.1 uncharacterized protein LOC118644087 isoform X2 [Monomorium pharaonis]
MSNNRIAVAMNGSMTNYVVEKQLESDDLRPASLDRHPERHGIEKPANRTLAGTVEEILRQVQRELCLIQLCWPDVSMITEDLYARALPDTYRCVRNKERLLLWYAENFRRQFHAKYTNRRPLLLTCKNECHVQLMNA